MYTWQALVSPKLYRLFFYIALIGTLYLMFNVPSQIAASGWINDKVAHFITFFFLTLFLSRGLPKWYGWKALLALSIFGLVIELIQFALPWRSLSLADWIADIAGVLGYHILHMIREKLVTVKRTANRSNSDVSGED